MIHNRMALYPDFQRPKGLIGIYAQVIPSAETVDQALYSGVEPLKRFEWQHSPLL